MSCFPCAHPADYDAESYKWFRQEGLLCETHEKVKPKETYILKTTPNQFVPKIQKKEEKSFYEKERPDNDGSLIE